MFKKEVEESRMKEKVLAVFVLSGKIMEFDSVESASEYTRISAGRIKFCIESGQLWRGWTFDII